MPNRAFIVSQVDWSDYKPVLRAIRESVFIIEQQVPKALEWDDRDEDALHLLATDTDGEGIATARMTAQGQIGRMAVLRDWRNSGVGSAMLTRLLQLAEAERLPPPYLNAQQSAIPFYRRHGFHPVGEAFMEAGIVHQRMERDWPDWSHHE